MGIITEEELLKYSNKALTLSESLFNFRALSKEAKVSVFLSHKHGEKAELVAALSFLEHFGIAVYVDWEDEGMPQRASGKTAERLKQKINESDKFIFLATEGALKSTWCNWELGLGDAAKFIKNIAIFPLKPSFVAYSGTEYLQIYPYIYESDRYRGEYYVMSPNKKAISVQDWLKA